MHKEIDQNACVHMLTSLDASIIDKNFFTPMFSLKKKQQHIYNYKSTSHKRVNLQLYTMGLGAHSSLATTIVARAYTET